MNQPYTDNLARVREEFEQWRSQSSGRGRIPDRLWRMAVDLLDHVSPSVVCRELHLAASDLKKRRLALAGTIDAASYTPPFVELRAVDLGGSANRPARDSDPNEPPVRLELTRGDGARLVVDIPSSQWARVEALCAAFLAG